MASTVAENLEVINEKIYKAVRRSGRALKEVSLVAITKGVEVKLIKQAISAGLRTFGENYVQEAQEKIDKIKRSSVSWHFTGHLQKNKVKQAVGLFKMIQTVDSYSLAKELSKRAEGPLDILLQVNLSGEKSKYGVDRKGAIDLVARIVDLENLNLKGFMTIPPAFGDPRLSKPYYTSLRRLAEEINRQHLTKIPLNELSMGMSNDFEVAIEEGATIIRIGTAIFGERKKQ